MAKTLCLIFLIHLFILHSNSQPYTQSYLFPFNGTANSINSYYAPSYPLGILSLNYSITILITIPNAGPTTQLNTLVSALSLKFVDESKGSSIVTSAVNKNGGGFIFPPASSKYTYSVTYAISFPSTYVLTSAPFVIFVSNSQAISSLKLDYYTLEVRSFISNQGQTVGNINVNVILKIVDTMRSNIIKIIYVSQPATPLNFQISPAAYSAGAQVNDIFSARLRSISISSLNSQGFSLNDYSITAGSLVQSNERIAATALGKQPNYKSNISHFTTTLPSAGFYILQLQTNQNIPFNGELRFSTDPYACPFNSEFIDYYSNFQGCKTATQPSGAPCIGYDRITRQCALCIQGYILLNGSCIANTSCPPRQYYKFGACYDVDSDCGDYDLFTGDCLSCRDYNKFTLSLGKCIQISVKCGVRQWKQNNTCFDVSPTCGNFQQESGRCINCINNQYYLDFEGKCLQWVINCSEGQYIKNQTCIDIPYECLQFNFSVGQCLSCRQGYYLSSGSCETIICPEGKYPSRYGIQCLDISSLCASYDPLNGNCLSCKSSQHALRQGACVQIISPLAGCRQRQALGFGECVGADQFCQTFNLLSGDCETCISGYYLDFTGHCVLSKKCGPREWSVNGECLSFPDHCKKIDSVGLCALCDENYRLIQGQCIYFQKCGPRQYLDNGYCMNVDNNCATWNPTNGLCITCKAVGVQPTTGVCCPIGQIYTSSACVDAKDYIRKYEKSKIPMCIVRHPSLNFCLQCSQGSSPDYTMPFACVASDS